MTVQIILRFLGLTFVVAALVGAPTAMAAAAPQKSAPPPAHYRMGKSPRPEFSVGNKSYKIDPEAKSTKGVRALAPEHFDPIARPQKVESFYREKLKERFEESAHRAALGPFRGQFVDWVRHWPARLRARWAWHHRIYFGDALWAEWMADPDFAAEIADLGRHNEPQVIGWLPPEYEGISPVLIYNDEFVNAAYNPIPFMMVLKFKSLKPDPSTDWIGSAAAGSLVSRLSTVPGLFLADPDQVAGALKEQKLPEAQMLDANKAAQVGRALDMEQVVIGDYVVDGDKVLFDVRIVMAQTGAIQNAFSKTVARQGLLDEMPDVAAAIAEAFDYPVETKHADTVDEPTPSTVSTVKLSPSAIIGHGGHPMVEDAPAGTVLVGFEFSSKHVKEKGIKPHDIIRSARAIYRGPAGEVTGKQFGSPDGEVTRIVARPGYGVSAISAATGAKHIFRLTLHFVRVNGMKSNPADMYDAASYGMALEETTTIGGANAVVGVRISSGDNVDSIELIGAP